jgi:hypothetical protein
MIMLSESMNYRLFFFNHCITVCFIQNMPPKAVHIVAPETLSPPPRSVDTVDSASSGQKRPNPPACDASPKKMIRNIVNISIADWMARCPDGSPTGSTGSGSTYAVLLEAEPCQTITTKKDQRRVAKKAITIGDNTGKTASVTIWGNFAARSWTFPEGSVLLFKNLTFASYYQDKLQLKFADPDAACELLITKAPDILDITKSLKAWFAHSCMFSY